VSVLYLVDDLDPLRILVHNLVEQILLVTAKDGKYDIDIQSFKFFFGAGSIERTQPYIVKNVLRLVFDASIIKSQLSC
jgi:hypothetical protein